MIGVSRIELAQKSDGDRYSRLTLALEADGSLVLTEHSTGASMLAVWGVDDQEITVRIPSHEVRRLAFSLVAEHLRGQADASRILTDLCEAHDIDFGIASWT
ncbi:MAG TPA: hypothetical protein VHY34_12530 [Caulobacteraceae bacterium]|jgi:hypothetical protein|nr:hypothetical protein [Caulobacteraceae bacterium]